MSQSELPKIYDPKKVEDKIYKIWEDSGFFNPDNLSDRKEKYANILPPPNANGELHIGHASGYVTMDLLGRYNRMLGKKVLLLPGKDHAGIQTQVVYEKKIKKERGISRHDLGRDKFYQEIYDFCIDRSQYMRNQEKKLGLSADWSREKFTLNPNLVNIVLETFVQMYNEVDNEGNRMAYKGKRIINWCPRCASALADVEVEHEETTSKLYWIKYGPFVLATSRPETKLGDTAVAVHPDDDRYKDMVGKKYMIPGVLGEFEVLVIADKEVDMSFGSGAIKVTPAHSFTDNEIAIRHRLPSRQIIDESGKMMANCGKYAGMSTKEAREAIVTDMQKMGLIDHIEDNYIQNLSVCERCKTPIEPIPSEQWFINVDHKNFSLKNEARKVISNEDIKIHPASFKKIMLNWIDNVHDWCISRQIWWGPRIPAWYKDGEIKVQLDSPGKDWVQEEDTFDTWFSSGQWSYTTLEYPEGKDFKDFYPSNNMIMGRDILPFWAFRMIILSLYKTKQIPFKNLYFTGLIRDEKGLKMSKSKGNGIEPLEMIEKFGTDAVRLSVLIGSSPGNDMNLGETKIESYRNFVNKLWNISRFVIAKIGANVTEEKIDEENLTSADKWIISKAKNLITEVTTNLEKYNFSLAGEKLQDFTKNDFADWYLEVAKFEDNQTEKNIILKKILEDLLKLWHPFIPFVTEEVWSNLNKEKLLLIEAWPTLESWNEISDKNHDTESHIFIKTQTIITAIRNLRAENKIEPTKKVKAIIYAETNFDELKNNEILITNLRTGISELILAKSGEKPADAIYTIVDGIEIYLISEVNKEKEQQRIQEELRNLTKYVAGLEQKLNNVEFIKKAPSQIVAQEKEKLASVKLNISEIKKHLEKLE
ncbi:MAG: valine--tRNA ligase [Parcubacteria group bacterium]